VPSFALTDLAARNLKLVPEKPVSHLDKATKGFGARATESCGMTYTLTSDEHRKRLKPGVTKPSAIVETAKRQTRP
jgi:hypothetical protein